MAVRYSRHLQIRLWLRGVDFGLPERISEQAEERFHDVATGNQIAVKRVYLHGKERDVMVAYRTEGELVILLTVHPLKEGQKHNRIASGRWVRI
ncbi:hypothetical protein M1O56_06115 [Dehalococcoidia bacterium]|nr:hypothetical protein [Dehalococcoidia bacterium]MCL0079213.1 hypothetical protein [Dehalococcoidia bacterium]